MKSIARPFVIFLLLAMGPIACGSFGNHGVEFPLKPSRAEMNFPTNSEITATISLSRHGIKEDYLLALSTQVGSFNAGFLTPQGIPLSSVNYSGKKLHISNHASMASLLSPQVIMSYLELIYRDEQGIQTLLKRNWTFKTSADKRRFMRDSAAQVSVADFYISYRGEAPWYQAVDVVDRGRGQMFSIRILGRAHAVPE